MCQREVFFVTAGRAAVQVPPSEPDSHRAPVRGGSLSRHETRRDRRTTARRHQHSLNLFFCCERCDSETECRRS